MLCSWVVTRFRLAIILISYKLEQNFELCLLWFRDWSRWSFVSRTISKTLLLLHKLAPSSTTVIVASRLVTSIVILWTSSSLINPTSWSDWFRRQLTAARLYPASRGSTRDARAQARCVIARVNRDIRLGHSFSSVSEFFFTRDAIADVASIYYILFCALIA